MVIEKRTALRVPLTVTVTYRVNQQEREEAYRVESLNIGEGGIFLKTDLPLGIGTEVRIEFSLPESTETLRFCGEVAWSGNFYDGAENPILGKGIKFVGCDERCRMELMKYLEKGS